MNRPLSLKLALAALALPLSLTACSSLVADPGGTGYAAEHAGSGQASQGTAGAGGTIDSASIPAADAASILALVNYPDTDDALLDVTIGLDSRAAKNIVTARNGADGACPSADDAPFASLTALDAVPYVGSSALSKLQAYATAHPAPKGETVEGVAFSGWQSVAVVWGVNHSTAAQLDAFLDSRAAKALAAGAPFASVAQMGPLSYVGEAALKALRDHAQGWWTASMTSAFVLDAATLAADAEMLKESLAEDEGFTEKTLIPLAGDKNDSVAILQALEKQIDVLTAPLLGTTYADADAAQAAVDAAAPVKNLTKSGGWSYLESIGVKPPAAMACVASFEVSVIPHLGDLLFMSESDRPLDVVFFEGQGGSAPTAASVLALLDATVGVTPGSTTETRDPSNYYVDFEPSSGTADPNAAAAVQAAIAAQLTDVIYVAVIPPLGSPNQALVDVYLVGRTSCGDLVGLHAVSVET